MNDHGKSRSLKTSSLAEKRSRERPGPSLCRVASIVLFCWLVAVVMTTAAAFGSPPCRPCAGLATSDPAAVIASLGSAPELSVRAVG